LHDFCCGSGSRASCFTGEIVPSRSGIHFPLPNRSPAA
jgi:hypothetical protein